MTSPLRPSIAGDHASVARELKDFRIDIERFKDGKVPDAIFLEHRLRFGVYGQRQDGVHMLRSKLPLGLITAEQLIAFADIIERFGNNNAHLTTRQDIQTHFVPLESTPDLMGVMNDFAMTSREACGNVVRNNTASPLSGVQQGEAFDVTGIGMGLAQFLLKNPDAQSLGRKFKAHLAVNDDPEFNQCAFHDLGLTAVIKDGKEGFRMHVGGGLGAVPHEALLFADFVEPEEVFPLAQAMLKIFGDHGEKKKRARARMKFLVSAWGIDKFREEVLTYRKTLPDDPQWKRFCSEQWANAFAEHPAHAPSDVAPEPSDDVEKAWLDANVYEQRQQGYAAIKFHVPRGDLDPGQLRGIAALMREHSGEDTLRIGLDQSMYLRWVPWDRVFRVREALLKIGLGDHVAGGLADPVTCPGSDSCKLGITSPRGLARVIGDELRELARDPRAARLRFHVSGCPNSCAQHHIGDIGWFGASRMKDGRPAPHYMLLLGGHVGGKARDGVLGSGFGKAVTRLPASKVAEATARLVKAYLEESQAGEGFGEFYLRLGNKRPKDMLADLLELPGPEDAPELYRDMGQDDDFIVERGIGECAGMPVELSDFLLTEGEREAAEALSAFADGDEKSARDHAVRAFTAGARALLSTEGLNTVADEELEQQFRTRFYDAGRIFEGTGFYFFEAWGERDKPIEADRLRRLVDECGLFVEEAHTMISRMRAPTPKTKSNDNVVGLTTKA